MNPMLPCSLCPSGTTDQLKQYANERACSAPLQLPNFGYRFFRNTGFGNSSQDEAVNTGLRPAEVNAKRCWDGAVASDSKTIVYK